MDAVFRSSSLCRSVDVSGKLRPKLWTVALSQGNDRYMKYFKLWIAKALRASGWGGGRQREDCKIQATFDSRHRSCVF
ncbi:hypothetical protein DPMN_007612 [Dreissena polymorpha]|uniref:Uncharacterized protein n=1 Tax=Dreissena polymorpha TaxID=45954 RepID=A0A9D4RYV8_DREPO|nr:hypothetical protein DPMN_007612 [Dreissena polymorpha]